MSRDFEASKQPDTHIASAARFKVEALNLDRHRAGFCALLLDLHKHYYANSALDFEEVARYFNDVMRNNLAHYAVYVCVDDANTIIGFAACYASMSFVELQSDKTLQLQLKEFFVREAFRSRGAGSLLMQRILEEARRTGCYRVDWNVRDWNERGIRFYTQFGAKFVEDRRSMRIELVS